MNHLSLLKNFSQNNDQVKVFLQQQALSWLERIETLSGHFFDDLKTFLLKKHSLFTNFTHSKDDKDDSYVAGVFVVSMNGTV